MARIKVYTTNEANAERMGIMGEKATRIDMTTTEAYRLATLVRSDAHRLNGGEFYLTAEESYLLAATLFHAAGEEAPAREATALAQAARRAANEKESRIIPTGYEHAVSNRDSEKD